MVCYSTDGKSGFLTKQGIADIKSILAKEIFQQDLISVYQRQTQWRDELTEDAGEVMRKLLSEMQSGTLDSQRIGQLMARLGEAAQLVEVDRHGSQAGRSRGAGTKPGLNLFLPF